jgi:hypothetical protein
MFKQKDAVSRQKGAWAVPPAEHSAGLDLFPARLSHSGGVTFCIKAKSKKGHYFNMGTSGILFYDSENLPHLIIRFIPKQ